MTHTVSEITDLRIYPIKSCRGISVKSAKLTRQGLELDRRWMFVDSSKKFVTIRSKEQMTLINTAVDESAGELVVTIRKDQDKQIRVPLFPSRGWLEEHADLINVDVWEYITDAYEYKDPKIKSIFSEFFGEDVSLVMKGPTPRIIRGNGDSEHLGRTESVNFPDVLPVLIGTESSLEELNSRLEQGGHKAITIERFRPNIVIKGDAPWSEDEWKTVRINGDSSYLTSMMGGNRNAIDIDVVARCARCQVPNVDPETAEKNPKQPWDLLVSYRRVDEGIKWKPCFGMLSCPRNEGHVEVGMRFEVTAVTQAHKYIKGF
ncbi:hypothetical protein B0A52_02446 [Exophiala mesophila]|uniref:MOSC domain-containing protein n=1 Tax=Exophiala mesophila TaxID=212818 RepID=A0A438ND02_EXOME|nr:hypothetical protein B0A52_02446 [Exophiala mesophila]